MNTVYKKPDLPPRSGQRLLYIDIETYSTQDLRKVTPYRYAEDPEFRILMAAYAVDDGPVRVAFGADIHAIPGLWDATVIKVAHNAAFERVCFSRFDGMPTGRYLHPETWHDTMAIAAERGYPQSLKALAVALGAEEKDDAGTHLINWFCKPDRNGERRRGEDHPEKWQQFVDYCVQDVVTLRDVHKRLGGWPTETERLVYMADQRINDRGMGIDLEMAVAATRQVSENNDADLQKIRAITQLENPNSIVQLRDWLAQRAQQERLDAELGDPDAVAFPTPDDLRAETVEKLLSGPLPADVADVLQMRQNIALAASKKFPAAVAAANADARLRGGFRFFGAHTGRWAGKGVQPHNLTRAQFETEDETEAAILDLKMGLGADAQDLKKLVRALFVGPFTVVDYAAIEARVISWLAGESWALDAFENGRDIYVETANRMGPDFTRSAGKIAVLALGYNGGKNSLRVMAGAYGMDFTDNEAQTIVDTWRRANPAIVNMWRDMETAFRTGGLVGDWLVIEKDGTDRAIKLPSGRAIVYHGVQHRWMETDYGRRLTASFIDPGRGGHRVGTYGGRLSENVTQAVARDVLAEALMRLDMTPHRVVAHVHDEILVEGDSSVAEISKIMTAPPPWAKGLPIAGAGFRCRRYRKD